jgi:hypothetical protein
MYLFYVFLTGNVTRLNFNEVYANGKNMTILHKFCPIYLWSFVLCTHRTSKSFNFPFFVLRKSGLITSSSSEDPSEYKIS